MKRILYLFLTLLLAGCATQSGGDRQILYSLTEMPIVDMHTHLNGKEEFKQCVKTMDEWGGAISITMNLNDSGLRQFIDDSLNGRILMAGRGKDLTAAEVQAIKDQGYVGIKSHLRYHTLPSQVPEEQIEKMGELNLPFIAMHVADPPEDHYYVPDKFMVHQQDGERVAHKHPNTIFIMAHGFYLTNRDADIDTLRKFFDRNPNLYVDIACTKWWDAPQPSYAKIRKLLIDYKDRFLFGTDFKVQRSAPAFRFMREKLETDKPLTFGMNGGPGPGLALPLDVLNHIYYWNAAQIIPGVKEALIRLGYEISDKPPKSLPVEPGLDYNPPPIRVLLHQDTTNLAGGLFNVVADLSTYDRSVNARLVVRDTKKKPVKTIFQGELIGKKSLQWDMRDEKGDKVAAGFYRLWLDLDGNKSVESNFVLK